MKWKVEKKRMERNKMMKRSNKISIRVEERVGGEP
jgi:hypothetical protein